MRYLKLYEAFTNFIDKRVINQRKKDLGNIKNNVEIRIDIEKIQHTTDRQYRHGLDSRIEDGDIVETIEMAIEEITIALMQDQFDIYQAEDNYPTRGIRAGEPNRFVICRRNAIPDMETLNIVCELRPGADEFTLTVITVMCADNFRKYPGQWSVEV